MSFAARVNRTQAPPTLPGPVVRLYEYPTTTFTDVIPQGAVQVVIEVGGGGGGGGGSNTTAMGGGGGGGGVGRSTYPITPAQWGQTFNGSLGPGGAGAPPLPQVGSPGANTVVQSGTFSTAVTVTATGGGFGYYTNLGSPGPGGVGGNGYQCQVNIPGGTGANWEAGGGGGAGAAGAYISGGAGGRGNVYPTSQTGISGAPGNAALVYT